MLQSCVFSIIFFILFEKLLCENVDVRQKAYPPCKACRVFANSFQESIEDIMQKRLESGDTPSDINVDEKEAQLATIKESVCSQIEEGRNQCYLLSNEHNHVMKKWWFNDRTNEPDFFQYLCINILKVCCLDFHYGPDCLPCNGFPNNVCTNNGHCKGAGTRKGNGQCVCTAGYSGENCDNCALNYYEDYRDNNKVLCSKCHMSCKDKCKASGPSGCFNCAPGWSMEKERGCIDINECLNIEPVCKQSEFCVNFEGSYKCLKCDRSCDGCTGDGPDMCVSCAAGYVFVDNICIDSATEQRKNHVLLTRYLTYLGLVITTCIILQRNLIVAAIVGLCVGIYISLSEYILNAPPSITDSKIHIPNIP